MYFSFLANIGIIKNRFFIYWPLYCCDSLAAAKKTIEELEKK